jgi:hypothetical protein
MRSFDQRSRNSSRMRVVSLSRPSFRPTGQTVHMPVSSTARLVWLLLKYSSMLLFLSWSNGIPRVCTGKLELVRSKVSLNISVALPLLTVLRQILQESPHHTRHQKIPKFTSGLMKVPYKRASASLRTILRPKASYDRVDHDRCR